MSEWLKDIKERFVKYQYDYNLNGEDVEYLIQQAERAQWLEKALKHQTEHFSISFDLLEKQNKRYREALEFYAERDNYQWEISYRPQQEIDCMVIDDSGHTARKALKGETK